MIRLVDPNKHHMIKILDVDFKIRSLTVREKLSTIEQLGKLQPSSESFDNLIAQLSSVILAIDGRPSIEVLESIESFSDLISVVKGVIDYCSLTNEQTKNSNSSSDISTPDPTGN